jgi:uncharacterized protein YlxW (UPF0749 family)
VRKIYSQIMLGIVCCILGFMLAHQFKELSGNGNQVVIQTTASGYNDLTSDNEQLKKVKEQLEKENNQVLEELKKYETQATSKDEKSKDIKLQLDDSRVLLGLKDVEGQGITIFITPKSSIFSNNARQYLNYREMVYLINELHFAGAEAIAVNDNRIVSQSFIKPSTNSETLIINDDKISPKNRIVIKAIGDKNILEEHITFPMLLDFEGLVNYDIKIEKSDSIKIPKYNKTYNDDYLK